MKFFYQILIIPSIAASPSCTSQQLPTPNSTQQLESTTTSTRVTNSLDANVTQINSSAERKGTQNDNHKSNKPDVSSPKDQKVSKTSSWNFKSLRSNDIKCNDFVEAKNDNLKSNRSGTVTASDLLKQQKTKPNNIKDNTTKIIPETVTSSNSNNHCNNDDVFSSMKKQQQQQQQQQQDDARKNEHFKININKKIKESIGKQYGQKNDINSPNIVVSIPQSRRVSLSDDDFENLSLATLKTANKKTKSTNLKQSVSVDESMLNRRNDDHKPDIPKLKIELSSLKAKISLNKSKSVCAEVSRSCDLERDTIYPTQVDLTEYAKNIGLKPISRNSRDDNEKKSDSSYEGGSSHKKRKKGGKHSREPGSKRRKFHAEISSQEEGKLKVKITGNKLSKHERKNSSASSSDDNNILSRNGTPEAVEEKPQSDKEKLTELRKVRHKPTLKLVNNHGTITTTFSGIDRTDDDVKIQSVHPTTPYPTVSLSSAFTFAKPKAALTDVRPKPAAVKTYLSGVKFPVKVNTPPPILPINNPRMFSPPHIPNFLMPQPKNVSSPSGPFPVSRPNNAPIKRSYSTDNPQLVKQLKLEPITRKMSIPDLIHAPPIRISPKPLEAKPMEPYYNSAMSSTYTHEITTKKPTPILLPPSSISVTKMSDTPKPIENFNNRPALEIVRISPTAPTVDQQHNQQIIEQKNQLKSISPKATRPPPSTIPLVKIRNANNVNNIAMQRKIAATTGSATLIKPKPMATEKKLDAAAPNKSHNSSDISGPLDLSGRTDNISVPERKLPPLSPSSSSSVAKQPQRTANDSQKSIESVSSTQDNFNAQNDKIQPRNSDKSDVRVDVSSNVPQNNSANINIADKKDVKLQFKVNSSSETKPSSTLSTAQLITTLRQMSSMPKLNEINKMRSPTVRQQNASVRNIPNPSALAFRNQAMTHKTVEKQPTSSASTPTASINNPILTMNSTSTTHTSTSTSYAQNNTRVTSSTCAPHQVKPNATSTLSNAVVSTKPATPSSSSSAATTTTSKTSTPTQTKQITISKQPNLSSSSNNDVNNAKLIAAKKNLQIEKVVATLRAAASENSSTNNKVSTVA